MKGFIPTGWYPTAVAVTPDGKKLLVGVGKGNQTKANPHRARRSRARRRKTTTSPAGAAGPFPYIGTTLSGALSIVPVPDDKTAGRATPSRSIATAPIPTSCSRPRRIPRRRPSRPRSATRRRSSTSSTSSRRTAPTIRSSATCPAATATRRCVMFGEKVTPNHHKLADEFVLLDNLYCNGQVSADGHPWSTMAYNTDYIARNWALTYSGRDGRRRRRRGRPVERPLAATSGTPARGRPDLPQLRRIRRPRQPARRHVPDGRRACRAWSATSAPSTASPRSGRPASRDTDSVEIFLEEFREFEKNGNLPRFIVMSLGEDHTTGHHARHVHAAGLRRQQRPGAGPAGRGGQQQQVLAGDGDLRHRGRRPERPRPRRCPPHGRPGDQPLRQAQASRQHAVQHGQHAAHDGADPRPAAAEPVRRGRPPDVRLVHRQGRPDALHARAGRGST